MARGRLGLDGLDSLHNQRQLGGNNRDQRLSSRVLLEAARAFDRQHPGTAARRRQGRDDGAGGGSLPATTWRADDRKAAPIGLSASAATVGSRASVRPG